MDDPKGKAPEKKWSPEMRRLALRMSMEVAAQEAKEKFKVEDEDLFGVLLHGHSPSAKRWMREEEGGE